MIPFSFSSDVSQKHDFKLRKVSFVYNAIARGDFYG